MWHLTNSTTPSAATFAPNNEVAISLENSKLVLEKVINDFSKKSGTSLEVHRAKVAVAIDKSGAMHSNFYNGEVQSILARLFPLALKFDDSGKLRVFVFDTHCQLITPSMDVNNFSTYVDTQIIKSGYIPSGCTSYAPVIETTLAEMGCYNYSSPIPRLVIVITNEETNNKLQTDKAICKSSLFPAFFSFIGIQSPLFNYLQDLDKLSGREVNNTAFIKCADISAMSDDELYSKLLDPYFQWLKDMHFI